MTIDREMLHYLAQLAALDIEPAEAEELVDNLRDILQYVNRIGGHELRPLREAESTTLRRQDRAVTYPSEQLFETAPSMLDRMFSTPVVTDSLSQPSSRDRSE